MTRFQVYKDKAGEFRWRLRANNHEIIAQGEGYTRKQSCLHCIKVIMEQAADADIEDLTKE